MAQTIDKPNSGTYVLCFQDCSDLLWEKLLLIEKTFEIGGWRTKIFQKKILFNLPSLNVPIKFAMMVIEHLDQG